MSQSLKGITATTISESSETAKSNDNDTNLVRRRSSSVDLNANQEIPAAMHITGSTNDFGLGVTSWW